jgi:hypothetical protein
MFCGTSLMRVFYPGAYDSTINSDLWLALRSRDMFVKSHTRSICLPYHMRLQYSGKISVLFSCQFDRERAIPSFSTLRVLVCRVSYLVQSSAGRTASFFTRCQRMWIVVRLSSLLLVMGLSLEPEWKSREPCLHRKMRYALWHLTRWQRIAVDCRWSFEMVCGW